MENERYPRERQAAWDARNLRTISTHLTRDEAATLRSTCRRNGTTPYRLLQDLLRGYVAREKRRAAAVAELARRELAKRGG